MVKTTISIIKCDVGSLAGHHTVPEPLLKIAERKLSEAQESGLINSHFVFHAGDDLELLMVHQRGESNEEIHKLAWDTFQEAAKKAVDLKLYAAGQDILKTSFSGNIRGLGPGVAEMEIEERKSDPIIVFAADKTEPGAFNFPLFKIFADPFNTAGLVIDPNMTGGFKFEVLDVYENKKVVLKCPEEMYDLIALIGTPGQYVISHVWRASDDLVCAATSTTRLSLIAGKYVGKDDPVMLVRTQMNFPATGEILSPYTLGHFVAGFMRGSHNGPLLPVKKNSSISFFDGPPVVSCLAFSMKNGKLTEPVDCFDQPYWDYVRMKISQKAEEIRKQGFIGPAMLPMSELEYTGVMETLKELEKRFKIRK